jgi:arylsulfatase A-like enzyme
MQLSARLIVALVVSLSTLHAALNAASRPSFIVFVADDMAWNDCGAYGHRKIRTPSIDRLAREGLRFDRAFLTISSCSPSRCSILTGRYPHATGAGELHLPLSGEQVTLFELLRKAGYYTAASGKWHLGNATRPKVDKIYGGGGPSGCGNWVKALEERPKDRPFFLWLAAVDPHRGYSKNTIPEPHGPSDAVVPPYLPDVEDTRRDLALYYDEIARMDGFIGRVIDKLAEQGAAEDTVVLFLSDNGRPFPRCKTTVYDSGVRTPFIVRWPAKVKAGTTTGSIVSSVDIAPTFLELAGAKRAETFQGKSFASILANPTATTRRYAFAEHNWHDYTAHERAVRSSRFLYIWNAYPDLAGTPPADAVRSPTYLVMRRFRDADKLSVNQMGCFKTPRPVEQLFDTEADPHSLCNLAGDSKHAKVLAEMRAALAEWKKRTADEVSDKRRPDGFHRELGTRVKGNSKRRN